MKFTLKIFLKAIGIYALLTTPALKDMSVYFASLFGAFVFGFAAWVVFVLVLGILQYLPLRKKTQWLILIFSIPVGVAAGYTLVELFSLINHVWRLRELLLLPLAAVIAGWTSLFIHKARIEKYFWILAEETEI